MIVSASYRTDIPAFYADWLARRLAAGWARVRNPYGGPPARIDLAAGAVDAFVFWTRNIAPLEPLLDRLPAPFVVQYTVLGYPRALDERVPRVDEAVARIRALAARWGRRAVVWRYDPIVLTSLTPPAWHRRQFAGLAAGLAGAVDEAVISFVEPYRKSVRNLDRAAREAGFAWDRPDDAAKQALADELAAIAGRHAIRLTACTQPSLRLPPAACIDAARLSDIAGRPVRARQKGNRPGCLCAESRDLGAYDSCPHGCVYCYAVRSRGRALAAWRAHDPAADSL